MFLDRDARFDTESERYTLRWQCEDCALFDAARGCAHGYPTERHSQKTADPALIVFCKDFEIG